jgi:dTDP-4-amino-4,6-dideoxygalactose transaminase
LTDWRIPLADVRLGDQEIEAVLRVMRSGWLTMGPRTSEFERRFAEYHASPHAIAVSSGTAALHLAYAAVGVEPGDEVVMPALTFVATANVAIACGAKPVFADIVDVHEPTVDVAHVDALITPRTRAIAVVHYGGYPGRVAELAELARRRGVALIEDCAHAPGLRVDDRYLGTWGTVGCFSFFSSKNMTSGEGGMIVTDNSALAERVRRLRSHGMTSGTWKRHNERPQGYDVIEPGWNYRIDEIRSAMALIQLENLQESNRKRVALTHLYRERLRSVPHVAVPFEKSPDTTAAHLFPLLTDSKEIRRVVVGALADAGVQTSHHYPPTHLFQYYRDRFGYRDGMLPKTEEFAACEITLPMYATMESNDAEYVTDVIHGALQNPASKPGRVG